MNYTAYEQRTVSGDPHHEREVVTGYGLGFPPEMGAGSEVQSSATHRPEEAAERPLSAQVARAAGDLGVRGSL